jgi:hypothetical protein
MILAGVLLHSAVPPFPCGKFLFTDEALFTLHILLSLAWLFAPVEKTSKLEKIVHAEC